MAARRARGDSALAPVARERQDLATEWQAKDKELIAARSEPPARRNGQHETALFDRLAAIDDRIAQIDKTLVREFPEYAALIRPEPLAVPDVQGLLRADEALLLVLDTPEWRPRPTPEESFIWLVTKTDVRWVTRVPCSRSSIRSLAMKSTVSRHWPTLTVCPFTRPSANSTPHHQPTNFP